MNWVAGAGSVVATGGILYMFASPKPADVYDMPMDQAYSLLKNADLDAGYLKLKTGGSVRTSSGNGVDRVTWSNRGSHGSRVCDINLSPFEGDPERTHVAIGCRGGAMSDGVAAGVNHRLHRESQIERIDATLTGRAFDGKRAGATSARWPGDGVDGSVGNAAVKAIKMDAEASRQRRQSRNR